MAVHNHSDFILSPITEILEDAVSANAGIGDGIETYPLYDYVMQSVFLKMTGYQEQKMKCICWDMATHDYEYRYKRYTLKTLGECSAYDEKKIIYKDLIDQIKKNDSGFELPSIINHGTLVAKIKQDIEQIFLNTNLASWAQNSFADFVATPNLILAHHFASESNLFENVLQEKYALLFIHRNRCAHNTQSYQQNLPTLKTLLKENYRYDNYFVRFYLLILIDEIFRKLYKSYLDLLGDET